jgi:hypothetical protein
MSINNDAPALNKRGPSCGDCRYTAGQVGGSRTCHRYPQPHRVAVSYWCGEYKSLTEDKPIEKGKGLRARLTVTDAPTVTRAAQD